MTDPVSAVPALSWRDAAWVAVGGALGTGLRHAATLATDSWVTPHLTAAVARVPVATVTVNLIGAFALGLLVGVLSRRSGAAAARARLLWGTGLLGGFTTYSALALDVVDLVHTGRIGTAAIYGIGTVALGVVAAWAGLRTGHGRGLDVGEEAP